MMNTQQLQDFLTEQFPQVADDFHVRVNDTGKLTVEMLITDKNLRPGQTVSGPSMFALADVSFYLAILQHIGPEALSVTTSATINFMRKPKAEPLIGVPRIHKLGRRLVVGRRGTIRKTSKVRKLPPTVLARICLLSIWKRPVPICLRSWMARRSMMRT